MIIPDKYKNLANAVRNEVYGRDVRESIAKSIEETGASSEAAIEITQQLIDGSFDEGELNTEIERKLNELEQEYAPKLTQLTEQLADTDEQVINKRMSDNASYIEPFYIETFDGSNEPYHPAVVYFTNPEGWNGYRFWMVHTPFPIANKPPYRARWECPSILRSPDGQDWRKPFNAPNPLVDLTQEEIDRGDYYSDPCIVMNGQTMEIWYRKTNGANRTQTDIYRITTDDGETFTEPEIVLAPLRPDNGFPGTMGMRAQQVFLNGSKYEAFFSLQGGADGEMAYAETTSPSGGIWTNFTKLNMINAPKNMSIWHAGMYKEGSTYHMIGYDINNRALQYFTSSNKIDFHYEATPIEAKSILSNLSSLYQSVPVKIDDYWAVYVGGTFRNSYNSRKNGISLFYGKTLKSLTPISPRQKHFKYFPTLDNDYEENEVARNYYGTYVDFNRDRFNGYGMRFGEGDDETNVPVWRQNTKTHNILHIYDYNGRPVTTPEHVGMIYRDTTRNNELYISIGTNSPDDWQKIILPRRLKRINASSTINADGAGILGIEHAGTDITNMTGAVEGEEIIIINITSGQSVTIKNQAGGNGQFRVGEDVVLGVYETLTVIKIGGRWYKK